MKKYIFGFVTLGAFVFLCVLSCNKKSFKAEKEPLDQDAYVVFWFNEQTSKNFIRDSIDHIFIAIDGTVFNSRNTKVFWTKGPACGEVGAITFHQFLERSRPVMKTYEVRNFAGKVLIKGYFTFLADSCAKYEIEWK